MNRGKVMMKRKQMPFRYKNQRLFIKTSKNVYVLLLYIRSNYEV